MSLITMTDKGAEELKRRTAMGEGAVGILVSLTTKGCSGVTPKMEHVFDEDLGVHDKFEHNGAVIYVPKDQVLHLVGTEIDFVEDGLSSMFKFNIPGAKDYCGCGESFSLDMKK